MTSIAASPSPSAASSSSSLARAMREARAAYDSSDFKAALSHYLNAVELDPKSMEAIANAALCSTRLGEPLVTRELFERALALDPKWFEGRLCLADVLDDLSLDYDALKEYKIAYGLNENSFDCCFNYGLALAKSASLGEAHDMARRCVRLDPNNPRAEAFLADCMNRLGSFKPEQIVLFADRAIQHAEERAKKKGDPDLAAYLEAGKSASMTAGMVLEQANEGLKAVKYYKKAYEVFNGGSTALLRLLFLLNNLNRREDALVVEKSLSELSQKEAKKDPLGARLVSSLLGKEPAGETASEEGAPQAGLSALCEAVLTHGRLYDSNALCHKGRLAKHLTTAGHVEDVLPKSTHVNNTEELNRAVKTIIDSAKSPRLCFVKDPSVQRGQGIKIVAAKSYEENDVERVEMEVNHPVVVQEAVFPLLTPQGFKFGIRIQALAVCTKNAPNRLAVYVFDQGILTYCLAPYCELSDSPLSHIPSTSVQRADPRFKRDASKGPASELYPKGPAAYVELMRKIQKNIFTCVEASAKHGKLHIAGLTAPVALQMFGFDVMPSRLGEAFIAEANASPQFQDAKSLPTLRETFAKPMIHGVVGVVEAELRRAPADRREGFAECPRKILGGVGQWNYVGDVLL